MKTLLVAATTSALCLVSVSSIANDSACDQSLNASFIEGAPRDNFKFTNLSNEPWQVKTIALDLANSAGKLIFDTKKGGDGVEVFQLYKTESGSATVADVMQPEDGTDKIKLEFAEFKNQQSFGFSIDVDDTLTNSSLGQIRVTGGELSGAVLSVTFANQSDTVTLNGTYGEDNTAQLRSESCQ